MSCINDLGDYLERIKTVIQTEVGEKAMVIYPSEIEEADATKPQICLAKMTALYSEVCEDGRDEEQFDVDILIKVPSGTSIGPAEVTALRIASTLMKLIQFQRWEFDSDSSDNPEQIKGDTAAWGEAFAGYQVTFVQTIRYGSFEEETIGVVDWEITPKGGVNELGTSVS